MPVRGRPVLEYWLHALAEIGVDSVLVNLHHHAEEVRAFLGQEQYRGWVETVTEPELLGTGGSLLKNRDFLNGYTALVAHADNLCVCDFSEFVGFHQGGRPGATAMTMMTFVAPNSQNCGIVELDGKGVVIGFHEKVEHPPGDLASAAVFLIEPEVIAALADMGEVNFDFSREVVPRYLGKIATWHNDDRLVDIGTIASLKTIQMEDLPVLPERNTGWFEAFANNPIHDWLERI
jgi:mannose-1-phosphate guanylyltransferase